jgi:formamidopyrimidine-DNA glycosylase
VRGRKAPIKALLLDQALLAGVGNIYADEASSSPACGRPAPASRVTREECDKIARRGPPRAARVRSRRAAAASATTSRPDGSSGAYQDERRVYGREGEPCLRCRAMLRRIVIGQRSAHYCPRCQS